MSWFNNLSIRIKVLSIAFIALTGFLLYLGVNFYANRDVAGYLQGIQTYDVPALQHINETSVAMVQLRESYAAAISERDELILMAAQESALKINNQLRDKIADSSRASIEQRKLSKIFNEYNHHANDLAKAMIMNTLSPEEGKEKLKQLSAMQGDFDRQMDITRQAVYDGFVEKITDVRKNNDRLLLIGLVMGTLLAIVVLALSLLITNKMIIGPLSNAVRAANKIAEGDWAISIVNASRDELGVMLRAIQKMRDRLKSRFDEDRRDERIKSTVAELAGRMSGDLSLDVLSGNILSYLVPSVKGKVGLIYIAKGNELLLSGTYAFTYRKNMPSQIKLGEGVVGQAALEKKKIVLSRVPEDYMEVSSGLGRVTPRHIVVIPVLHENELCAVLEIGSLDEFSDEDMEILDLSIEHISVAIMSAISRKQLSEMLLQTTQQADQLKKQQEEMQFINNDLEEQAMALSVSEMRLQEQQNELKVANEELEEQAQALRASEESLQAQQEELRVINEELEAQARLLSDQRNELQEKNDALSESTAILEEKTRALELSGKYKSEFLSTMSHELRTPLNSILILSNSLSDNKPGNLNEKQIEHAKVIHSAGSDLLSLINDILDISKVEEGKMQLVVESLSVNDIGDYFRKNFDHIAQHKGLDFSVAVSSDAPALIYTDRQRLEQILRNFLSNSLKFTHAGSVSLTIESAPAGMKYKRITSDRGPIMAFSVKDTGIGVPKEKQEQIFEAFQQADGTTSRKYGGTGLGLTISREFAHLLGGEVRLTSEGEGTGCTFTLYLPVGAVSSEQKSFVSPMLSTPAFMNDPAAPLKMQTQSGQKTLLIIEDDEDFADVLSELATDFGFRSLVSHDGERGLEMVKQTLPDAVILDIGLPGIDGWQVLEMLKNDPATKDIPIHCFSGRDDLEKAMHMGAIAYYKKPASLEQIKEAFSRIEEQTLRGVRRLLVVEDNSIQHSAIHDLFEESNVDVTVCTTGQEALDNLKREEFDCIILDLSLPDIDGYTLLETIHTDDAYPNIPVIVYTARDLTREQEARLRKYADRIILKTDQSSGRLLSEASLFLHWVESQEPSKSRASDNTTHRDDIFSGKKVLLVDDDMRNIYALSASLEDWNCEVVIANNGIEGLEALDNDPEIDIVLMDIMMPEMDGYEAMQKIRLQDRFKKLPILALTAKAMKEDRQKCIDAGANDYITKPLDIEKLQSLMRVWLHH